MATFYGNMRSNSGVPNTSALNTVESFPGTTGEYYTTISGVTKDSTGAIAGGVKVELLATATKTKIAETVSDSVTGVFSFYATPGQFHQGIAYKVGAPDIAGITVDTLVGS